MGIETALLGASLMSSTAGASTVGLLGAGGVFSAAAAGSTLMTGLSIFSGLSAIMGGISANKEAGRQSELALQQAESRGAEQARLSAREARLTQEESDEARRRQKVAFLASGVTLEGSPLLVMEETRTRGAENVEEILRAGSASANAARQEGRIQANKLKASGREQFTSGLTQGFQSIGGAFA